MGMGHGASLGRWVGETVRIGRGVETGQLVGMKLGRMRLVGINEVQHRGCCGGGGCVGFV